jgi:transmembrane sensor
MLMIDVARSGEERGRSGEAGEWLLRLNDPEVSEETLAQWIEWCDSDERNLRAFEQMQSVWRAAAKHPPDARQLALLMRSDHQGPDRGRPSRMVPRARRWFAVVASIAAISAMALLLLREPGARLGNPTVLRAGTVDSVNTPVAMNQEAVLPDGSRVELGARSALDVEFTGTQRTLELRTGQAFFRVKHDSAHPFIVDAGNVRVIAVGTAFDVRKSGTQVAVTIQEGTVEVRSVVNQDATPVRATAGYQLVIDTPTGIIRRSIVDPEMTTAWRSGRLEFAGDPLDVVIASVNRYSARPIVLGDPALGQLIFTGTVFVDSIDASLDAMQQVFPLDVHRSEHEVILIKRAK